MDEMTVAAARLSRQPLAPRASLLAISSTIAGTRAVADAVNKLGPLDSVIHNASVGYCESRRLETEPGVPRVFAVNVLAPYILTALIETPKVSAR
jgi:NAD(P)-dependent dehydrogenase (short-subunit alcohol dehydrogenase family)